MLPQATTSTRGTQDALIGVKATSLLLRCQLHTCLSGISFRLAPFLLFVRQGPSQGPSHRIVSGANLTPAALPEPALGPWPLVLENPAAVRPGPGAPVASGKGAKSSAASAARAAASGSDNGLVPASAAAAPATYANGLMPASSSAGIGCRTALPVDLSLAGASRGTAGRGHAAVSMLLQQTSKA